MSSMMYTVICDPDEFDEVRTRKRTALLQYKHRDYSVDDGLKLVEYDSRTGQYSGNVILCLITHVLSDFEGLKPGWVMISFAIPISYPHT